MTEPLTPDCPMCGQHPYMVMGGGTQAFCGNDKDCPVLTWNPMETAEEFRRKARVVQWEPSGEAKDGTEGEAGDGG